MPRIRDSLKVFHHIHTVPTITDRHRYAMRESFPDRASEACARLQSRPNVRQRNFEPAL